MAVVAHIQEITETVEGHLYVVAEYRDSDTDQRLALEDFIFVGLATAEIREVDIDEYGRVEIGGQRVFPQDLVGGEWVDRPDLADAKVNVTEPDEDYFEDEVLEAVLRYGAEVVETGKALGITRGRGPGLDRRKLQPDRQALRAVRQRRERADVTEDLGTVRRRMIRRRRERFRAGR